MNIKFVLIGITLVTVCILNEACRVSNEAKYLNYRIIGIDSINNYYLISVTRDQIMFMIISDKVTSTSGRKIKSGKKYNFNLISMLSDKPIKDLSELPKNRSLVSCYYFDDSTEICYRKNYTRDFYRVENLKGLDLSK